MIGAVSLGPDNDLSTGVVLHMPLGSAEPQMRVLYVEDDPTNRRVVKAILSSSGAEMAEAFDGQAGLDALAADTYDPVLMDLRMPGMDGLTAIRHIRAR